MNRERRKELENARTDLQECLAGLDGIKERLEQAKDDEQDYFDNMPENMQGGEKGDKAQASIDALEELISAIDEMVGNDLDGYFDTAVE